jgi:ketosteroid isomerase-like protein
VSANEELMGRFAERVNAGDLDGWVELYAENIAFVASDSWPETATVTGRQGLRDFWSEFTGVWEDVQLRIDRVHDAGHAVVGECRWVTRGRASGVEGTLDFVVGLWIEDGLVVRGQFFDELGDALEAVGLGD